MGRHGSAGEPPDPDDGRPWVRRLRGWLRTAAERLALAAVAGAATGGVLLWAGTPTHTAWLVAGGVAAVVLLATWAAASVPGPPASDDAPPGEPRGGR